MAEKVSFDPVTKIIQVTEAPTNGVLSLDMSADVYGAAKREWLANESLTKFRIPFSVLGGQDIGGGKYVGSYFFLRTDLDWKIRPYDSSHELIVVGNLYPYVAGQTLFIPTVSGNSVLVLAERSILAQKVETAPTTDLSQIIQWLQADQKLTPTEAVRYDKDTKEEIWKKDVTGGNLLSTIELKEP